MAKPLEWQRQPDASYAWALGLHYYVEKADPGEWQVACMAGNDDIWDGDVTDTRKRGEAKAQADFNARIAEWID